MAGSVANARKANTSGANTCTTASFTSAAGDAIWVGVIDASGQGSLTISDNKGNTFTQIGTTRTSASGAQIRRYRAVNIAGGAGHTVTATWGSNSDATVHVLHLTGVSTNPLDVSADGDDSNPPWTVTSPTLTQADSIALALTGCAFSGTWSESSGFTIQTEEGNNALYWTGAAASKVVNATTALTPSFTISGGGSDCAVSIDVFKAAAAGSGITGAGQISSGEALGAPGVGAAVAPAGVASAQALGTPVVAASVAAAGIASAEQVGQPAIGAAISAAGVASGEALGGPAVAASIGAAGIASAEAVGAPVVNGSGIFAAGIPSAEAFGLPALAARITAAGIGSGEALGQPTVGTPAPAPERNAGFEMVGRRLPERNIKPLLHRVLERRYPRVKPAKERAQRRAKVIEQAAAQLIADDPQNLARFDALMRDWMAERPVVPPGLDLSALAALFEAQVGFRLRQLQLEQQAREALAAAQARDEEDALAVILLLS